MQRERLNCCTWNLAFELALDFHLYKPMASSHVAKSNTLVLTRITDWAAFAWPVEQEETSKGGVP